MVGDGFIMQHPQDLNLGFAIIHGIEVRVQQAL